MQRMRRTVVAAIGAIAGVLVSVLASAPAVISSWKW
jgi:hypothetical protein